MYCFRQYFGIQICIVLDNILGYKYVLFLTIFWDTNMYCFRQYFGIQICIVLDNILGYKYVLFLTIFWDTNMYCFWQYFGIQICIVFDNILGYKYVLFLTIFWAKVLSLHLYNELSVIWPHFLWSRSDIFGINELTQGPGGSMS
jgi:hypothetical protein